MLALGCLWGGKEVDVKGSINAKPLQWPEPPEKARIRYLEYISGPEDLGIKRGFLRRALEYIAGNKDRGFIRLYGVAADGDFLVVADPGAGGIHIFDREENTYLFLDKVGDHTLRSPVGVAINGKRIYVSDSEKNAIFVINKRGRLLDIIGEKIGFKRPSGIALWREKNRLYVSDTENHRVCAIDLTGGGRLLFFTGIRGTADGQFNFPTNIWFDERRKRLIVSDSMNFRIQIFEPDGRFIRAFGEAGDSSGYFARPRGVATDSDGNIYVVDALFDTVQIFNEKGDLLLYFGKRGEGAGEFWLPAGIFIDDRDRIFVTDSYNKRVQIFEYVR